MTTVLDPPPTATATSTSTIGLAALVPDPSRFHADAWTVSPVRLDPPAAPSAVFSMADAVRLLTQPLLGPPHIRMVLAGRAVAESSYTEERHVGHTTLVDCINPDAVMDYFAQGATVVIDALDLLDARVHDWCSALAEDLDHPVGASGSARSSARPGIGRVLADLEALHTGRLHDVWCPDGVHLEEGASGKLLATFAGVRVGFPVSRRDALERLASGSFVEVGELTANPPSLAPLVARGIVSSGRKIR